MRLMISIKLVRSDRATTGTVVDEWTGTYDLDGSLDQANGLIARIRKIVRRELIRLSLIVPTDEDKGR